MNDHDAVLARARGVTRRFGDFVAVDGVDLELRAGEVVGLLGANGAGKTTLIRLLLGLLRPSAGEIALFGEPPSRRTRRRLGYVPQTLGLYDDLTPAENLAFARRAFGVASPGTIEPDGTSTPVGRLPLGLQRRLAFAVALDHRPDVLVLDEPSSGVAPLARARLWETIRAAADRGVGVLVTTHYMDEAAECDRLVIMATGGVVAAGTAAEIVGDASVLAIDGDDWTTVLARLDAAGRRAALAGRTVRVLGATRSEVDRLVEGLQAEVREVPATLEERFFELAAGMRRGAALGTT